MSQVPEGIPGTVWPLPSMPLLDRMRLLQRQLWIEEHFVGQPPDNNKTGSSSFLEQVSGGGTADAGSGAVTAQDGGVGQGQLTLPARPAPVAPDGAGFRLVTGATSQIIRPNDLVGEVCMIWRTQNDNPPQAGSDYISHGGVIDAEANEAETSDGFYLFGDDASPNWILKHRRAGAEAAANTGLAMTTAAWQTLAVVANVDDGIVTMFGADDGDLIRPLATVTPANMQPAVAITSMVALHNPGNITLAAVVLYDYLGFGIDYGVFR